MCFLSAPGDFVLARNGAVLASKAKRDAARSRPCGRRGAMCVCCGLVRGVISTELYSRLLDSDFVLREPVSAVVNAAPPSLDT
jgi:hypothetical protein